MAEAEAVFVEEALVEAEVEANLVNQLCTRAPFNADTAANLRAKKLIARLNKEKNRNKQILQRSWKRRASCLWPIYRFQMMSTTKMYGF